MSLMESVANVEAAGQPRKVLMSPEIMDVIAAMRASMEPDVEVTVDWGEPDADGWWTPTVHVRRFDLPERQGERVPR